MTLSNAISIMDAFRSRPDRPTDLWTSEVVVAHQSGLPATRKPILRALGKARRSAEGRMLSSVARRLVEEARRLLKHHSSARANPGPAATFPTLWWYPIPPQDVGPGSSAADILLNHLFFQEDMPLGSVLHTHRTAVRAILSKWSHKRVIY